MEHVPLFTGMVIGGKFRLDNKARFAKLVKSLEGKQIAITLGAHENLRSLSQNGWYWGVAVPILAGHLGYDKEECHQALKWHLLRTHTDSKVPTVRSTSELSTREFSQYMDDIVRFGTEMGVLIPLPNEVL